MLTSIEWWGGLLLVWGALVLRFLLRAAAAGSTAPGRTCTALAYGVPGLALLLYFHELPWRWYPQLLAGVTALGLVCLLLYLYVDLSLHQSSDAASDEDSEEEPGPLLMLACGILLLAPPVLVVILAALRSFSLLYPADSFL